MPLVQVSWSAHLLWCILNNLQVITLFSRSIRNFSAFLSYGRIFNKHQLPPISTITIFFPTPHQTSSDPFRLDFIRSAISHFNRIQYCDLMSSLQYRVSLRTLYLYLIFGFGYHIFPFSSIVFGVISWQLRSIIRLISVCIRGTASI